MDSTSSPQMETRWLKESLFAGMTANAFKLGTVLTLGWFWQRTGGCSVLYRGESIEQINFDDMLTVAELQAGQISPPSYLQHNSNSTYYYLVRQVNNCGEQEQTLFCAAKVSIGADGDLAQPQPNNIFHAKAEQVNNNRIRLLWFYSPIEQQSPPVCFNIYYDNGSGQIDYENPVAVIDYAGRKFYSCQSGVLAANRYLFAIRTQDAAGVENSSSGRIKVQLDTSNPEPVDILSVEAS